MLLSDRDILAAQSAGHISLDPWTPEMVQPASIDVRLDRYFRLFNNHAYTYVDPAENQGALTEQFEVLPTNRGFCTLASSHWVPRGNTSSWTRPLPPVWKARAHWADWGFSPIRLRASLTPVSRGILRLSCLMCRRCRSNYGLA